MPALLRTLRTATAPALALALVGCFGAKQEYHENQAASFLRSGLFPAQEVFRAYGALDADGDQRGEYAETLEQLVAGGQLRVPADTAAQYEVVLVPATGIDQREVYFAAMMKPKNTRYRAFLITQQGTLHVAPGEAATVPSPADVDSRTIPAGWAVH